MEQKSIKQYHQSMNPQTTTETLALLKGFKNFDHLSPEALKAMASTSVIREYKANQFLWNFGDRGDHCTLIISGLVEISRPTGVEEDTCMGIFGPGDTVGLSALLQKINFPGTAKTLSESKTIKFYLGTINHSKENEKILIEISNWMRESILTHEHILREKIDIISAGTIEDRLRELFGHLLRRFGNIKSGCMYEINIKLPKSKAARLMGIRNETAIRLINDWQKRNLILWKSDKILIHDLDMIDRYIMQSRSK